MFHASGSGAPDGKLLNECLYGHVPRSHAVKLDRGVLAAIGAAMLFGVSTPLAKPLLGEMPPLLLAGSLYVGSGIGLSVLLGIRVATGGRKAISWPRGADICWLLGAIVVGGAVGPYLLMYGLQTTDSASASLILNLEGVFTALLAWFAFKENVDRRIALGMAFIVAGGVALSMGPKLSAEGLVGATAIAGACLAWAIDNNLTRKVSLHDAMFIACAKGLVAGVTSVALALAYDAKLPAVAIALQAGLLGFFSYGLSLTLFVVALRSLGTARTGAYFSLAPFIGAALAVVLGAPLTAALVAAGLLMGVGVWLHLTERHEHRHRHVLAEHVHQHTHDAHHQHRHGPEWNGKEPHTHAHGHEPVEHTHAHYPDAHHRHPH
jgi:drug/metabolite transporter (DMT)-like permease